MEEKIMEAIKENPGRRMREIAYLVSMDPIKEVLPILHRLKTKGKIKFVMHRDIANMEFYDRWYANC